MHLNPHKTSVPDTEEAPLRVSDLTIDPATRSVERAGEAIDVRGLSFDLLWELAKASPRPVSRDLLIERVWSQRHVEDHTINQRVSMLRKALGDDGEPHRYIRRMPGEGYALAEAGPAGQAKRAAFSPPGMSARRWIWIALATLAAIIAGATLWLSRGEERPLTQQEIIAQLDEPITLEMQARVIYNREDSALRIGSTEPFDTPMLGTFDGVDMFVAGVPATDELIRVPRAFELVCRMRDNPAEGFERVEPAWREYLRSQDLAGACAESA